MTSIPPQDELTVPKRMRYAEQQWIENFTMLGIMFHNHGNDDAQTLLFPSQSGARRVQSTTRDLT
jgi:hypothetical protein